MSTSTYSSAAVASGTPSQVSPGTPGRRVVDAPTRMFHWLFALTFTGAYLTAESEHWRLLHVTLGYAFAGLLVFRLLYGIAGPSHTRLGLLWRRVSGTASWIGALRSARSAQSVNWRQGQNLSLGWGILLMLALVAPLVISGYGSYNEWGPAWASDALEEVHEFFGNALLTLVIVHLVLILGLSMLRRHNLALPMLTGHVRGTGPHLVKHNRAWLAGLLLVAVVTFFTWQWLAAPDDPSLSQETTAQTSATTAGSAPRLAQNARLKSAA